MDRTSVVVRATDPISQAGVMAQLTSRSEVRIVSGRDGYPPDCIHLVVVDDLDEAGLQLVRSVSRHGSTATVLVATHLDDTSVVKAVEAGVVGIVRRCEATRRLFEAWEGEGEWTKLSFLRSLYRVKPLCLALPVTWTGQRAPTHS